MLIFASGQKLIYACTVYTDICLQGQGCCVINVHCKNMPNFSSYSCCYLCFALQKYAKFFILLQLLLFMFCTAKICQISSLLFMLPEMVFTVNYQTLLSNINVHIEYLLWNLQLFYYFASFLYQRPEPEPIMIYIIG